MQRGQSRGDGKTVLWSIKHMIDSVEHLLGTRPQEIHFLSTIKGIPLRQSPEAATRHDCLEEMDRTLEQRMGWNSDCSHLFIHDHVHRGEYPKMWNREDCIQYVVFCDSNYNQIWSSFESQHPYQPRIKESLKSINLPRGIISTYKICIK
jgi:hypothetical protein